MRGINCRGLRLKLVAGLTIALLMPTLTVVAAHAQASTATTLTAGTLSGCSQALTVAVAASGSAVSSGTVTIEDDFNNGSQVQLVQLASVALSSAGTATPTVSLAEGSHSLTAVFNGTTADASSTSSAVAVSVASQCEFMVGVSNFTPATTPANTLTPGQTGTAIVSVIPSQEFVSSLTAPASVTLSCSGLPDNASCNFTPENVEILSTTTTALTSTMTIQTQAASTASASPSNRPGRRPTPIAWAFLLPGALGLSGVAWRTRRRRGARGTVSRWLSRFSLLMLVGLVTLLGTTACNPRYDYLNHGPSTNSATPAGTYPVTVTGVYSNGNTATTHSTTFVLTVN